MEKFEYQLFEGLILIKKLVTRESTKDVLRQYLLENRDFMTALVEHGHEFFSIDDADLSSFFILRNEAIKISEEKNQSSELDAQEILLKEFSTKFTYKKLVTKIFNHSFNKLFGWLITVSDLVQYWQRAKEWLSKVSLIISSAIKKAIVWILDALSRQMSKSKLAEIIIRLIGSIFLPIAILLGLTLAILRLFRSPIRTVRNFLNFD